MDASHVPFDPVRCAVLHSKLLAQSVNVSFPHFGSLRAVRQDVIPRMHDAASRWPKAVEITYDSPLYQFLLLIHVYDERGISL